MDAVVHFEIPADDFVRAKKFYADTFGWQIVEWPGSPTPYGLATTTPVGPKTQMPTNPGAINGAVMQRQTGQGGTVVTISVSSIDDYVKKVEAAGGKIVMPKTKVGEMGYVAQFTDTEGNVVGLWENAKS